MVYLHRAGASREPATEDDFSAVRPSLGHINSRPAALSVPSFLVNLHCAGLCCSAGEGAERVCRSRVLAASARAEHGRVGQPAGTIFSNADMGKCKIQKWSPSDSLFFRHTRSSGDIRNTHTHTLRQRGQGGLNVKLICACGILQPRHLNRKFLFVCFSTCASILHLLFFFPCF